MFVELDVPKTEPRPRSSIVTKPRARVERPATVADIQHIVAVYYGGTRDDIRGRPRGRRFSRPRQMAMTLCLEHTNRSLPEIGRYFGGRDHTTVLHAAKAVTERTQRRPETARDMDALRLRIVNHVALRELDTLPMRVWSAQLQQARWADPELVAMPPGELVPRETARPAKRVVLNAYGARRTTGDPFDPRNPIPSALGA